MDVNVAVLGSYAPSLINFRGPMLREMLARGHEVLALAPDMADGVRAELEAMGAQPVEVRLQRTGLNPLRDAASVMSLAGELRRLKPDLLFAYTIKPVVYGSVAARMAGVRRVHSMITGLGYAFGQGRGALKTLVVNLYRLALSLNSSVLFQNADDRDLFQDLRIIPPRKKTCITHGSGVDLDRFALSEAPEGPPLFLCISRLLKEKGVREFAAAARILKARRPEARFRLVGPFDPGPDAIDKSLVDSWVEDGFLEWPGPAEDVRPHLREASVSALPSYREGTPRSVLEAMATGRPVVTTNVPGCRQTVIPGETGFLVPPRDPEALAAAMERFVDEPALVPAMGLAGRALCEARFDVDKVNAIIMEALGL
ncbi:MAG: glycosyltransferase family 4 protein [Desulfovibrionaceae bacterium]